jgi:hypothetical protein
VSPPELSNLLTDNSFALYSDHGAKFEVFLLLDRHRHSTASFSMLILLVRALYLQGFETQSRYLQITTYYEHRATIPAADLHSCAASLVICGLCRPIVATERPVPCLKHSLVQEAPQPM